MDLHFRAFSFVDRIDPDRTAHRIRGRYLIPPGTVRFPASLVAEAIGQLAAWEAMAAVGFERRPVAGLAGSVEFLAPVRPGDHLSLVAELESVDADAVAYGGSAEVGGVTVIRLQHCVGPMVPLDEFDDPSALRQRFELLCGPGKEPGGFAGIPSLEFHPTGGEPGHSRRATLQVPASADLFADHFPRRPVFPGTLLMHVKLELARTLAVAIAPPSRGSRWAVRRVADVKLRAFIPPGQSLELEARLDESDGEQAALLVESRAGKRLVGSARVHLTPENSR